MNRPFLATTVILLATLAAVPLATADHPDCIRDGIVGEAYCSLPVHPTPAGVVEDAVYILCGEHGLNGCRDALHGGEYGCWDNFRLPQCYDLDLAP